MKSSIVALLAIRACGGPPSPAVVDLNLARAADLATLPGIDPPLADSIVDYRRFHGPFTSTAALAHVPAMARRVAALDGSVGVTACPCGAPQACVSGVCVRTDDGPIAYTTVAADHWNFARGGRSWVPIGVNYGRFDTRLSLAAAAHELDAIDDDFATMADLGIDAARITAYFHEVVSAPDRANEDLLGVLDEILLSARRHGVYVDLTGLALYDRAQVPAWLPALDDAAYRTQERLFWRTVAARYAHDPTIFAYDLQNEPFVSEANQPDIVGPEFGDTGFHFGSTITRNLQVPWQAWVHARYGSEAALSAAWGTAYPATATETWNNLLLDPGPAGNLARRRDGIDFRGEHAAAWAADLKAAIRAVDPRHLITVAVAAPFSPIYFYVDPAHIAPVVDFLCVHLYPQGDNIDELELTLRAAAVDMPVVIEEMASYVGPAQTDQFLSRTVGSASGWFAFFDGRSAEELMALPAPGPAQGAWLARFTRFGNEQAPRTGAVRTPGSVVVETSIKQVRTDAAEGQRVRDLSAAHRALGEQIDVKLAP